MFYYENQKFNIQPVYIGQNILNLIFEGIFEIKTVNIINIILNLNYIILQSKSIFIPQSFHFILYNISEYLQPARVVIFQYYAYDSHTPHQISKNHNMLAKLAFYKQI